MKQSTNLRPLTLLLSIITIQCFAQSSLYVSSGANFYITSGTFVSIDSLVLKPSADFIITGANSVTRDAAAIPPPPAAYIQRVYHLLTTLPAYSGDISIYYRDAELNGIAENTLTLNIYNGSAWNAYSANVTRDAVNNFVTTTGLTNIFINEATLAAPSGALPVTLSGFTVQSNHCVANLTWTTATEQNSRYFEVQLSTDGVNFTTITVVPSAGNSNTEKHYSCNINLNSQNNYFRLRLDDLNGTSKFSPVLNVAGNCGNSITEFPNPVHDIITISGLSGNNQLKLLDATGKVVAALTTSNRTEKINITRFPTGTYILQVIQNKTIIKSIKMIKKQG